MKKLIIHIILILTAHLVSFVKMWKKGYVRAAAETISHAHYAVVRQVFPVRDEDKNQPLNRLEFSFNRFDSLSAQDRKMSLLWLRAARICTRELCEGERCPLWARLTLFTWITLAPRFSILALWRGREKREKRRTNIGRCLPRTVAHSRM